MVRTRTCSTFFLAVWLLAAPSFAQLKAQDDGEHSALADVEGMPVRDDALAAAFKDLLVKDDAAAAKSAAFFFQGCFGGGMIDDLEKELAEKLPWVAGAASEDDGFAWFQTTAAEATAKAGRFEQERLTRAENALKAMNARQQFLEALPGAPMGLVKAELQWLKSAKRFTNKFIKQIKKRINDLKKIPQSLNVAKTPHGHWTRALLDELKVANQTLLLSITNARDKDKVGVKSKSKLESGQSAFKAKGDGIVLKGTAKKLYAVLWAGQTDIMAFFNDVDAMRTLLGNTWKGKVEFVILFGDGVNKVLKKDPKQKLEKLPWPALKATEKNLIDEIAKLKAKITKDDLVLFYATNHAMTDHDPPPVQAGNGAVPHRSGFSFTPAQLDGMNASSDVQATVTIQHMGVSSPNLGVRVNGIVLGLLEPFDDRQTFVVPEYLLTNCNVVELQSTVEGEAFPYAASVRLDTGPVAPVFVDGSVESDPEACPTVPLLTPFGANGAVGDTQTVTMQVFDGDGLPIAGSAVSVGVIDGPNAGVLDAGVTDASGQVAFDYVGDGGPGTDTLVASYEDEDGDEQISEPIEVVWHAVPEPVRCRFDVDGDDLPELELDDADGNGLCDFPEAKTHLHGDLVFTEDTPVEFRGTTILESDSIIIEEGARVIGTSSSLESLYLVATNGALTNRGTLTLSASDEILVRSLSGAIDLGGAPTLAATDQITIDARLGGVRLAPAPGVVSNAFTATGGNRVTVTAKSGRGAIEIVDASLAAKQLLIDGTASTSGTAPKGVVLDNAVLTTDPADVMLIGTPSTVSVKASAGTGMPGRTLVVRNGSRLASGSNLLIGTKTNAEGGCLSGGVTLRAKAGLGYIDLTQVRRPLVDDGTTILQGLLKGSIVAGACP